MGADASGQAERCVRENRQHRWRSRHAVCLYHSSSLFSLRRISPPKAHGRYQSLPLMQICIKIDNLQQENTRFALRLIIYIQHG